jgi:uncharacterized protein YceK
VNFNTNDNKKYKSATVWTNYAGLGSQLIVGLLLLLYIGKKGDAYWGFKPMLIWILPFTFILFTLYKIIKETKL